VTYFSTLNPLVSATVSPSELNLAFSFDLDASMQYSYTLDVSGVPDGGFVTYNDIELHKVPEPGSRELLTMAMLSFVAFVVYRILTVPTNQPRPLPMRARKGRSLARYRSVDGMPA
jgi:hypothetical protein